jgi:hypothetical protein
MKLCPFCHVDDGRHHKSCMVPAVRDMDVDAAQAMAAKKKIVEAKALEDAAKNEGRIKRLGLGVKP